MTVDRTASSHDRAHGPSPSASDDLDTIAPLLNLADMQERSVVNGPGERFVVWVQGCPRRCPGCFNQEFLPRQKRLVVSVAELAQRVLEVRGIEGVTFSGGEPFSQAAALAELSDVLRSGGLTIVSYSGWTLAELRASTDPGVHRLLGSLDVLIDGPYLEAQRAPLPWRGSANQQVHFLTGAYRHLVTEMDQPRREVEFAIGRDRTTSTGIFDPEFMRRFEAILSAGPAKWRPDAEENPMKLPVAPHPAERGPV